MHIFLIRHAESVSNAGENYTKRIPDHLVSLTEQGMRQAEEQGKWLAEYCRAKGVDLTHARIWRSPYLRTRQTSEEFNKALGISDIREDITLTEQQFGLFDSLPEEDWERLFPAEYAEYRRQRNNFGKFYARLPMGKVRLMLPCAYISSWGRSIATANVTGSILCLYSHTEPRFAPSFCAGFITHRNGITPRKIPKIAGYARSTAIPIADISTTDGFGASAGGASGCMHGHAAAGAAPCGRGRQRYAENMNVKE